MPAVKTMRSLDWSVALCVNRTVITPSTGRPITCDVSDMMPALGLSPSASHLRTYDSPTTRPETRIDMVYSGVKVPSPGM